MKESTYGKGVQRALIPSGWCAQGRANLREISHLKEAESLVRAMLVAAPKKRPSIASVMAHPFWWDSHRRLSFLVDLSDRMENEDREVRTWLLTCSTAHCN